METSQRSFPWRWPALRPPSPALFNGDGSALSGSARILPPSGLADCVGCVVSGLAAGVLSALLTLGVYAAEELFQKLPIHWMWWPAIGGVFVGLGGLIFPQALGVGYDTIRMLLAGKRAASDLCRRSAG